MTELVTSVADQIDRAVQRVTPLAYRMRRRGRRWMRRAMRKPRSVAEGPNLLPLLIQVLASFSKADGVLLEEEIDSSLGFLRYDYPETVYSELRHALPPGALRATGPLRDGAEARRPLSTDRKIMLGVQLYDLISQAGLKQEQVVAFYSFMSQLGMAAQAIDIVYQLNASEDSDQIDLSTRRLAAGIDFVWPQWRRRCRLEEPDGKRSSPRLPLSRSHPAEELQRAAGLGARPAAGARRFLPDLPRATNSCRRPGADVSGARDLFQREEECLPPADFRAGEPGRR